MDSTKGVGQRPQDTPSVKKGKNYVLAIGIDDYVHHRSLNNAVADAQAFVEVMTNRYGFENLIEPLYNKNATQRSIRRAIGKCESLNEHDRLIVFYSGHGWYKTAAQLGYLVPTEAEDDPNSDFIPVNFVTDIFRAVKAHHILLIVDCCFGGSFGVERNVTVTEMTEKVISELDIKKSRMVLSSGGIEPVSDGLVTDNNSPFTKPLIEILKENQEPQMVFSEFFTLLRKKTNWNTKQLPQYKVLQHLEHNDGELALYCVDLISQEEKDYQKAIEIKSIPLLEQFIKNYNSSVYKAEIRNLLKQRRAEVVWDKIKNSRHIEKFDEFIDEYPESDFREIAQRKISELEFVEEEITKPKPKPSLPHHYNTSKVEHPTIIIPKKFDFEPEMVFIEGGALQRGIQHVILSDFSIGKYPITQLQWHTIMGTNPSHFQGSNLPVEMISWDDCQDFLNKINKITKRKYSLPTEAEWEFAARGGNKSQRFEYSGSNNIDEVAWYSENSGEEKLTHDSAWYKLLNNSCKTHPVGYKSPNELGIYDMSGNVWEWCRDYYDEYSKKDIINPSGPETGTNRVFRGGSWRGNSEGCQVNYRHCYSPSYRDYTIGLRLVSYSL